MFRKLLAKVNEHEQLRPAAEADAIGDSDRTCKLRKYQLTIGSKPKFVWFRNAKVGTRTIYWLLKGSPVEFEVEHGNRVSFSPQEYGAHFKFAFVRNPWERLVSGWRNKILTGKVGLRRLPPDHVKQLTDFTTFVEFLATQDITRCNVHFRLQSALIDLNAVDFIGRFESFEQDVRRVLDAVDLECPATIPHRNRGNDRKPYQAYYSEETRRLTEEIYRKDIQVFGYGFDGAL